MITFIGFSSFQTTKEESMKEKCTDLGEGSAFTEILWNWHVCWRIFNIFALRNAIQNIYSPARNLATNTITLQTVNRVRSSRFGRIEFGVTMSIFSPSSGALDGFFRTVESKKYFSPKNRTFSKILILKFEETSKSIRQVSPTVIVWDLVAGEAPSSLFTAVGETKRVPGFDCCCLGGFCFIA